MVLLSAQTQPLPKPFTKDDVLKLLTGNVPANRVETLVHERGIDFQITPETESELRKAGATDPLLAALRDLAPKPPTLVVTTNPGGAQVFVDDELIARTSAEGRLKISNLAAGPHKLRVSLDGYRDHEENVNLTAGETLGVQIPLLEQNTQTSLPTAQPTSTDPSGEPGAAGVNASGPSIPGKEPTFLGEIVRGNFVLSWHYEGTITVGNGKLQVTRKGHLIFDVHLTDVVPRSLHKDSVVFDAPVRNGTATYTFKAANEQAAKEFYEALKVRSK
jgi:hypothetical protein